MIYEFPVTIEATNTEGNPAKEIVKLTHGVIHRLEVEFPAGQVGLIHVAIDHMGHQLWPTNPEGSFASDDYVVAFNDYYPLLGSPYTLTIRAWTDGTTYGHTVKVRFGLLPESIAKKIYGELSSADRQAMSAGLLTALTGAEGG